MIRILLAVLMLLLPVCATAQAVVVRSGAHEGFTRLVLDMPARIDWRLVPHDGGASISFAGPPLALDLDAVFERISRDRLRAASVVDGRLELEFACACEMRAFWHGARMLVLDIVPKPGPKPETMARPKPRPLVLPGGVVPRSFARMPLARRPDATLAFGGYKVAEIVDTPTVPRGAPDLSAVRAALLEQLGRAASQGLLTPARMKRATPATPDPAGDTREARETNAPSAPEPEAVLPQHAGHINMRAQSSIDRELVPLRSQSAVSSGQAHCPPEDWVDLSAWAGEGPFHEELGRLNRQLIGEFDRPDKGVALQLARLYLHHGFGAEARQVLALGDVADAQRDILREIAHIVDQDRDGPHPLLLRAVACEGPAVLWAVLSMVTLPQDLVFDHKALLRAFAALPEGLRRALGPVLARRLLQAGHSDTSDAIVRMIERAGRVDTPDVALVRAELATMDQDQATARSELDIAVAGNSTASAEAVVQLIEQLLAKDAPVPFDMAELAGAYAYEYRSTPLGHRMTRAYLAALAASGAHAQAIAEFDRLGIDLDPGHTENIAEILMRQITRNADDVTFLRHAISERFGRAQLFAPSLSRAIARRLLQAGFAGHAYRYVEPGLEGHGERASRILRAEIALVQERPRQAEVEILGLDGQDVNVLRARARSLAGDHATARGLYDEAGKKDAAARAALFASDPVALSMVADPVLRDVGDVLRQATVKPAVADDVTLERSRFLLDQASAARRSLERLLETRPAPSVPEG
ncbi:MAG: hypothetical protein RID11_10190 [Roseovarius sp.]|jgi:hypothetical protein|uniref:hypothetical protein n=1 Tax=Roseovarius sp. TaxID=1486281 RepID=UPI0032ED1DD2